VVFLKYTVLIIFLSFLCSCSHFGYYIEQGWGQLSINNRARWNKDVLKDEKVLPKHKEKIKKILEYKDYFYKYLNVEKTSLYNKTTILKSPAVSYLVIASKFNEVKAKKECFLIVGCFPYIGFFKEKSAIEHSKDLQDRSYITYIRPVYAYSTLGYLTDPILSSFFHFEDLDLAEIIFHELFHSVFFVKDEVELNENLANFIGRQMVFKYFDFNKDKQRSIISKRKKQNELKSYMVKLIKKLESTYQSLKPTTKIESEEILSKFLSKTFTPEVKNKCAQLGLSYCFALKRKWNNASFAAFLTYEEKVDTIIALKKKYSSDLKEFFQYLQKSYKTYLITDSKESFQSYLLQEIK